MQLGLKVTEYVGHVINQDGLSFDICRLPQNHKNLNAFLGLRDHLIFFASITRELQRIITPYKPRQRLHWTNELLLRSSTSCTQKIIYYSQGFLLTNITHWCVFVKIMQIRWHS